MNSVTVSVNGEERTVEEVPPDLRLLDLLRWRLGLRGTKEGCRTGDCGACTVLLDGQSVLSCLLLAPEADRREIVTVEGLSRSEAARKVQEAFAEAGAVQCGYCTPGFILAVHSLLREGPPEGGTWTVEDLRADLGGNLCRCTGYYGILRALARILGEGSGTPREPSTFRRAGREG